MSQLEEVDKLSYSQLVNILCILAVRLERLENLMGDLLKELDAQTEFQNYQIILTRTENMREGNKTPRFRLNELEKQFNGMVNFFNEKLSEVERKQGRKYKYS